MLNIFILSLLFISFKILDLLDFSFTFLSRCSSAHLLRECFLLPSDTMQYLIYKANFSLKCRKLTKTHFSLTTKCLFFWLCIFSNLFISISTMSIVACSIKISDIRGLLFIDTIDIPAVNTHRLKI